jgi:DNA-binding HxlR family transcriptional regulator
MRQEYGQFCPVALASEVLAERWTFLVVRELLAGARRFNEIRRGVPRLSATLLKQRLQTLEAEGIVERGRSARHPAVGYELTPAGVALKPVIAAVGEWGQRWARDIEAKDLDPRWLVWAMHRRLNTAAMPPGRTVIEFEFVDAPATARRFWLVHRAGTVDVCIKDPGHEPDVRVATPLRPWAEIWRGLRPLKAALRSGVVRLEGRAELRRAFPQWLKLSVFAPVGRFRQ